MSQNSDRPLRLAAARILANQSSRRAFLRGAAGATALGALGKHWAQPSVTSAAPPAATQILIDDVTEGTPAAFARGKAGAGAQAQGGRVVLPAAGSEFVSGPVQLPFGATHLGLHWTAQGGSQSTLSVEVRTRGAEGRWSAWQLLTVEAEGDGETFAALVPGLKSRTAQYRVTNTSDESAELTQMSLTAINTEDGPLLTSASVTEPSTVTLPVADGSSITITTRSGWGCDESLRFSSGAELWPEMYVPAKKVVLHHTATANNYTNGAAEVRAIYAYHAHTLGWGDIGYHLLVDKNGVVYEGRHGRGEDGAREIASADVVAGHVVGFNYGSTGVAAIGNSSQGNWRNTWGTANSKGLKAIEDAMTFECGRHYIDPHGNSDFLKADGVWEPAIDHCSGHGDLVATQCPGSTLINQLPNLRSNIAARLDGDAPPVLTGGLEGTNTLTFSWPAGSYFYSLEGWRRNFPGEDIEYLSGFTSGGWGDALAYQQVWTTTTETALSFSGLAVGHYTMHLRRNATGTAGRYASNRSFWITETDGTDPPPPAEDLPPTVAFTAPEDGDPVSGTLTLVASANDDNGVTRVEFFANGELVGTDSTGGDGWTAAWDSSLVSDGSCTLMARATDIIGQTTEAQISVTVENKTSSATSLHVGDIDGTSTSQGSTWTARVTVTVHDASHLPLAGATVAGAWGGGATGTQTRETIADGTCSFEVDRIPKRSGSVSFTVTGVSSSGTEYDSAANHDPDGESNGTAITISKP